MPVVDTTFLIDFQRKPQQWMEVAVNLAGYADASHEDIIVPHHVAVEFAAGRPSPERAWRTLEDAYLVAPLDRGEALRAAALAHRSMAEGTFPGLADVLTAGVALHRGMMVVTRNVRHFEPLGCEVWDYAKKPRPDRV